MQESRSHGFPLPAYIVRDLPLPVNRERLVFSATTGTLDLGTPIMLQSACRQAGLPADLLSDRVQKTGDDRMTDYEMIMIFLTILMLVITAQRRSDR